MTKYIFVTGGVVSSLGKGINAASLGRLLKNRGLSVTIQKFDPYINIDPGTMSPYQHGEVFVTKDGAEADLDLGHYERFIDIDLNKYSNVTMGKVYSRVLSKERSGAYNGATVQVIPHVTNEIKELIQRAGKEMNADVVITEIGGSVGDIESLPYLEALRQMKTDLGNQDVMYIHNTLVPYLSAAGEMKTKPTQHSVKELRSLGIQPNMIVTRSEYAMPQDMKDKIALFCNIRPSEVIEALDAETLYEVPLRLHEQQMDQIVVDFLGLESHEPDLTEIKDLVELVKSLDKKVTIGLVGKYVELQDAYISVVEAFSHAGYAFGAEVEVKWIDSSEVTKDNVAHFLHDVDGVVIPGGFGSRAIDGMIEAARFAREQRLPLLGIGLGLQIAAVEIARNIAGLHDAHSLEFDKETKHPIVHVVPNYDSAIGSELRLGAIPFNIEPNTKTAAAYNTTEASERHRHRYEVNPAYEAQLKEAGFIVTGRTEDGNIEIMEFEDHPFFIATQFHPEFVSRPTRPQPLIRNFIEASLKNER
ncbi:CTP synthase [Savagea sp. SN6]|uniref:CTP synthase n=1 Tax=Savagea serpentis TaxID=2785297 RepID=A0A8J7GCA3_9BACL|nr:CTP synthase [Savagea serpentis]MBF4501435.1 CTP synthase [Savagea serpentis]